MPPAGPRGPRRRPGSRPLAHRGGQLPHRGLEPGRRGSVEEHAIVHGARTRHVARANVAAVQLHGEAPGCGPGEVHGGPGLDHPVPGAAEDVRRGPHGPRAPRAGERVRRLRGGNVALKLEHQGLCAARLHHGAEGALVVGPALQGPGDLSVRAEAALVHVQASDKQRPRVENGVGTRARAQAHEGERAVVAREDDARGALPHGQLVPGTGELQRAVGQEGDHERREQEARKWRARHRPAHLALVQVALG
mmetsp:Transcript_19580/g.65779  ORF Transcript_19580/g.65779 Transcript_19580/m.65779 type:complete len:250 (-) Transcript_19580:122-871(-)